MRTLGLKGWVGFVAQGGPLLWCKNAEGTAISACLWGPDLLFFKSLQMPVPNLPTTTPGFSLQGS